MTQPQAALHRAQDHVEEAVHEASGFIRMLARVGYSSRGVVFVLIGALAGMTAIGAGGNLSGSKGALQTIISQPFGYILLGCVAVGFLGFATWQFVRAVVNPEHFGSDAKGVARRIAFFISGCIYIGLLIYCIRIIFAAIGFEAGERAVSAATGSDGAGGGEDSATSWSAWLMSYPFGRWLVAAIGIGVAIFGLVSLYKAYSARIGERLQLSRLSQGARRTVIAIGRFGIGARGVVFALIGAFFVMAAWYQNAQEARGLDGALRFIEQQAYGPWLLGVVALGLIAYGIYQFIEARYRRIEPSNKAGDS